MRFGRQGNAVMFVSIIPNVKDYPMRYQGARSMGQLCKQALIPRH